jgi:hypothetical protein
MFHYFKGDAMTNMYKFPAGSTEPYIGFYRYEFSHYRGGWWKVWDGELQRTKQFRTSKEAITYLKRRGYEF